MKVLSAIIANSILLTTALSLGSLLCSLFPKNFIRIDRIVAVLLGGLGMLGTILFCVGQVWFSRVAIVSVLVFCFLLGLRHLVGEVRTWKTPQARFPLPVLPVAIVVVITLLTIIGGCAEPVGDMNNDAIAYHYLGPTVWLRQGIIRAVPDEVLTYFPVVIETQYAALMSLGGQLAPGLFAIVGLVSICLVIASLASRLRLDQSGVWWTVALVVAMPAVYRGAYGGFIDALFAAFVLAAARIGFDAERLRDYALFGFFCGLSMGTKYTGIVASALLIFCSFSFSVWTNRGKPIGALKSLGVACTVATLVASPFYLRNWIIYGCPIYPPPPILLGFFTPHISLAVISEVVRNMTESGGGMGRGLKEFLLLPFNLTYHTSNFHGAGGIGLVPLALGPFGLIERRRDTFAKGLLLFGLLEVTSWFLTAQVSRYLILCYVLGGVFGILGWQHVCRLSSSFARILSALVLFISLFYGVVMIIQGRLDDVNSAISTSFEEKRRLRDTPFVQSFDYLNHDGFMKKVLILDENVAAYYIQKNYIKPFGRWGEEMHGASNLPELISTLPELGVTHVLDTRFEGGSFKLPDRPAGLTLVFERRNERVFRVE